MQDDTPFYIKSDGTCSRLAETGDSGELNVVGFTHHWAREARLRLKTNFQAETLPGKILDLHEYLTYDTTS